MPAIRNEDVRRLDVAVNDAGRVRRVQAIGDLDRQGKQSLCFNRLTRDHMLQRHALQEFHGDERSATLLADVVNRADVRMIQRRCGLGFTPEAFQRLRVVSNIFGQEFKRYKTVEARVLGLVNHTHPAASQSLEDAIVGDVLANQRRGLRHSPQILGCV